MKYLKLFYSLVAAGALLTASANAQTWPKPTTSDNFSVRSASVTSTGTPIDAAPVRDTSAAMDVLLTVSSYTSLTVREKNKALIEIANRSAEYRENYGPLLGGFIQLRLADRAVGRRPFLWGGWATAGTLVGGLLLKYMLPAIGG